MKFTTTVQKEAQVKYLLADCGVRYWEDATVDGVEDADGTLIPCRKGDRWEILIDLETGKIENWTAGTSADIHYKVCDDGIYEILDENKEVVIRVEGYVPAMLCPKDSGYGDYVIMGVEPTGQIVGWKADLSYFEREAA